MWRHDDVYRSGIQEKLGGKLRLFKLQVKDYTFKQVSKRSGSHDDDGTEVMFPTQQPPKLLAKK